MEVFMNRKMSEGAADVSEWIQTAIREVYVYL